MTFSRDLLEIMTVDELAAMNARQLAGIAEMIASEEQSIESIKTRLQTALERRYGEAVTTALAVKRTDTGTVQINDPQSNETSITVNIPKKTEWDNDLLLKALDSLPPEDARHYATVKVTVDERKFTAAPEAIRLKLAPARTVKPGKMKFTFKSGVGGS